MISYNLLQKRISYYHDFDIKISTGSTLTEFAISDYCFDKFIDEASEIGFDFIEIGENNVDLDIDKKKFSETVLFKDLEFRWKIGKKDPRH